MIDHQLQAQVEADSAAIEPAREATREVPSIDQIEAIERHLKGLPARQQMTVQSAIHRLKQSIENLRDRGYNLDEVASELKKHGLHVSGRTIARHLRSVAPKKRASAAQYPSTQST